MSYGLVVVYLQAHQLSEYKVTACETELFGEEGNYVRLADNISFMGGARNYYYHWFPGDDFSDPDILSTITNFLSEDIF